VEISIVAVLALLAGAFWVAVKKSAEHVAEIRKAEGNTTALATSPQRDEHVKQDITAIPGSNKPSVKTKAQAKHPAAAQQLDTEHLADELSKRIEGHKSTSAFKHDALLTVVKIEEFNKTLLWQRKQSEDACSSPLYS